MTRSSLAVFIAAASLVLGTSLASAQQPTGDDPGSFDGPPAPSPPEVMSREGGFDATVRAFRATEPVRVDGQLDEAWYRSVPPITGFIQSLPDEAAPATEKTEVWITFDETNVYIGARVWDSAPESDWIANELRRDTNQLRQNDTFGVMFDTYLDRRNGVMFYTNPLGAMADFSITNEGNFNPDWNPVWDVRTGRFDGGWTVEMAIPFKSLRYRPGSEQIWGVQLRRVIRRKNEWAHLTLIPRSAVGTGAQGALRISDAGTLVGIEAPPPSRNLEVRPYAIAGLRSDRIEASELSNDLYGDAGLDVKYGVTESLTLDLTYNTDFAQVEVDEQQVNLTRFNLAFPEKREFFLEGRGIFEFASVGVGGAGRRTSDVPTLFFSRRIGIHDGALVPIVAGSRLTGKVGRFDVGALSVQTNDAPEVGAASTNFSVLRLRRDILRRSSIGALFTHRSRSLVADGSNQTFGVDATFSFFDNLTLVGYLAGTETPELAGSEESYRGAFNYNGDRWGLQLDHLFVGESFNPEVGFLRRNGFRKNSVSARFSPRPSSIESIRQFTFQSNLEYLTDAEIGYVELRERRGDLGIEFESSDGFGATISDTYERLVVPFRIAPDVTIQPGAYSYRDFNVSYTFGLQRPISGNASLSRGTFFTGDRTSLGLSRGRIEVLPQLSIEPSISFNWIDLPEGSFTAHIAAARANYSFTPRMFLSGLLQYSSSNDTVNTNVRLRWEYARGSELFIVYTDARNMDVFDRFSELSNRGLVIKINRLFRP
ncbi:MAG: DUF5916 domain-containing protein [Gemmatimonadota bacterium]